MSGLPRRVAFRSLQTDAKFLSPDDSHKLTFCATDLLTCFTRFELELASSQPIPRTNLFNIRCCYNNKYWTRDYGGDKPITCDADQPDNDSSKTPSTLFHVKLEKNERVKILQYQGGEKLEELPSYRSEIVDMEKLELLPKFVAFIGDNGHFLQMQTLHDYEHLVFSGTDISDPSVIFKVTPSNDGSSSVTIGSAEDETWCWHCSPPNGYILGHDRKSNNDELFQVKRVENDMIALYSCGKGKFCQRYTSPYVVNSLKAEASTINQYAKLKVVEPVRSREIYNIRFHVDNARVYNKQSMTMVRKQIVNKSPDSMTTKITLQAEKKRVSSWNSSVNRKLGASTKISVDFKCAPVSLEAEISIESEEGEQWGESYETAELLGFEDNITVRPNTKAIISMVGTKAYVDLPFTYSQRDVLMNGETKIYDNLQDGVFHCVDTYNVETVIDVKDLDKSC